MRLYYMVKHYKIKSKLRNRTRKNLRGGDVELENIIEKLMDEVDTLKATVEKDRQTIGSLEIDVSDLQQKVVDLDNNAVVMIAYLKRFEGPGQRGSRIFFIPIIVNKNISKDEFIRLFIEKVNPLASELLTVSLQAIYTLPNIRGLNIKDAFRSFKSDDRDDNNYLEQMNYVALNQKYPGLFLSEEEGRRQEHERARLYQLEKERKFAPPSNSNGR